MSMKLRDLIRKVRACKTAAEERAVIAKESAMIRTAIREEQAHFRHRNVAKLLFMHMLGYPTHFGQLECMKLTASPHFPEKRIGYLGMMLLLSEEADVLMLATNALKNDLTSDNRFVCGLALCCIGNLATADMSRDLAPEVDKHLKSNMSYLRKKACLAMGRCLLKVPDMVDDFIDRVITLLKDKSHGVLVTVVQLMTQVLMIDYRNAEEEGEDPFTTQCRTAFLRLVPTLVKMLRNLMSTGYSVEHEVGGISDPFLQVQLLTLLRLLGVNNTKASEEMNDVLAQVATNTETAKNAGNAILYECVQTIMAVESEDGLRVLAVNILGRFLLNRDNNIRYVALNTLSRCIVEQKQAGNANADTIISVAEGDNANTAMSALQRHRTTVVECLKDPDISIRQRALELIYHLVNADNVESLTAELLNYLVLCPREHRADICTRILRVVDRYSPNERWRVDTLITTLTIAGRESTRDMQSATVIYISRANEDIHAFATHKLLKAIRDDDGTQYGLLSVGVWCIGEYGDLLLQPYSYQAPPSSPPPNNNNNATTTVMDLTSSDLGAGGGGTSITFMALSPLAIVSTIEDVTKRHACPEYVKERALTAYVKLSQRFANRGGNSIDDTTTTTTTALQRLEQLLEKHKVSQSLELQLRSCEYNALIDATKGISRSTAAAPKSTSAEDDLFGVSNGTAPANGTVSAAVINAAKEAIARMPVVDIKVLQKRLSTDEFGEVGGSGATSRALPSGITNSGGGGGGGGGAGPGGDLLDLNGIFGAAPTPAAPISGGGAPIENGVGGVVPHAEPKAAGAAAANPDAGKSDLDLLTDIFAAQATSGPTAPAAAATSGGYDPFSNPAAPQAATTTAVNPMDLFGAPPPAPAAAAAAMNIFGTQPNGSSTSAAAAAPPTTAAAVGGVGDIFGSPPPPAPMAPPPATASASSSSVRVPAINHNGLAIEFECSKPDTWNKQKSLLIAHFKNSNDAPLFGFNLQVAVPKSVTMELEPPTSTTIPVNGGGVGGGGKVTQKITVTNSMLGKKNLMLKLKLGFTLKGQKIEHMATASGFPAGEY